MKTLITILPEILLLTMLTSAFAILCLTLHKIFEQMQLFRGKLAVLMAGLVSVLAMATAAMLLIVPNNATETGRPRSISVNYSLLWALAVSGTVVLLQLFVIVATTPPAKTDEGLLKESANQPREPKSRGRRKKEETEAQLPAPNSSGKEKNKAKKSTAGEGVPKTESSS